MMYTIFVVVLIFCFARRKQYIETITIVIVKNLLKDFVFNNSKILVVCSRILLEEEDKNFIMEKRDTEIHSVKLANTERYEDSSIPYLQRLLKKNEEDK